MSNNVGLRKTSTAPSGQIALQPRLTQAPESGNETQLNHLNERGGGRTCRRETSSMTQYSVSDLFATRRVGKYTCRIVVSTCHMEIISEPPRLRGARHGPAQSTHLRHSAHERAALRFLFLAAEPTASSSSRSRVGPIVAGEKSECKREEWSKRRKLRTEGGTVNGLRRLVSAVSGNALR